VPTVYRGQGARSVRRLSAADDVPDEVELSCRQAGDEPARGLVASGVRFAAEEPLPTLYFSDRGSGDRGSGDLALTSTRPAGNTGGRVQVARCQADGSWLRIIDRPELPKPPDSHP
jgi:hypothetical protein